MKYPYDLDFYPPFPMLQIVLHNDEERLRTSAQNALLDTGSDGTLVPIIYLQEILALPTTDTRIRSHWGEWRSVQLFVVDVELENLRLPNIFVVGDDQGDQIILGAQCSQQAATTA